jgi:hypothetical protein
MTEKKNEESSTIASRKPRRHSLFGGLLVLLLAVCLGMVVFHPRLRRDLLRNIGTVYKEVNTQSNTSYEPDAIPNSTSSSPVTAKRAVASSDASTQEVHSAVRRPKCAHDTDYLDIASMILPVLDECPQLKSVTERGEFETATQYTQRKNRVAQEYQAEVAQHKSRFVGQKLNLCLPMETISRFNADYNHYDRIRFGASGLRKIPDYRVLCEPLRAGRGLVSMNLARTIDVEEMFMDLDQAKNVRRYADEGKLYVLVRFAVKDIEFINNYSRVGLRILDVRLLSEDGQPVWHKDISDMELFNQLEGLVGNIKFHPSRRDMAVRVRAVLEQYKVSTYLPELDASVSPGSQLHCRPDMPVAVGNLLVEVLKDVEVLDLRFDKQRGTSYFLTELGPKN